VPGTDDKHSWIIARKLSLLAAILFPSTMIGLIVPERTDKLPSDQTKYRQMITAHTFSGSSVNESRQVNRG